MMKPVILCILDGWGIGKPENNPIHSAKKTNLDKILKKGAVTEISASEEMVGLPVGQMGNSEVGHMTIGSGRVIYQDLVRINKAIKEQGFSYHSEIQNLHKKLKQTNKTCHIIGLLSDGGVHSHIDHIVFLSKAMVTLGIKTNIHVITDGRDTAPRSAIQFIEKLEKCNLSSSNLVSIATLSGRFYAMDRDQRWDRTKLYYDALCGNAIREKNAKDAILRNYNKNITDEFITPTIIGDFKGIEDGDGLIIANFRADRVRQILNSICNQDFSFFVRNKKLDFAYKIGMTQYSKELDVHLKCLFPEVKVNKTLGEIISDRGLKQLRIAETEKYAHVTFFFNAGKEELFVGEERILVESPKVRTYDLKPEMSAYEMTDILIDKIKENKFDFIVVNFANADMVGHTGNFTAIVKAVETIDNCLGRIYQEIEKNNGLLIIASDHGNAEQNLDHENNSHTAHTCNLVPFIFSRNIINGQKIKLNKGSLSDIAPTILDVMRIEKPGVMSGKSLIKNLEE